MNTPNLDRLMERSTSTPRTTESMMAQTILHEMFVEHGPAMVAAIKRAHVLIARYAALSDSAAIMPEGELRELLTKLDQEAACQK